jgi:hypothetical protein
MVRVHVCVCARRSSWYYTLPMYVKRWRCASPVVAVVVVMLVVVVVVVMLLERGRMGHCSPRQRDDDP